MSKCLSLLWMLLVAQLLLIVWLAWPHTNQANDKPLLTVKTAAVTQIDVIQQSHNKSNKLVIKKADDGWLLPQANAFPVDTQRVHNLLQQLKKLKDGLPVAVTPAAAKRFKVASDDYVKQLVLHQGSNKLTLYVGKSAGASRVYVRAGSGHNIYSVPLRTWLLSTDVNAWRNKQLLHVTTGHLKQVTFPQVTLQKQGAKWQVANNAADVSLSRNKVNVLLGRLAAMQYQSVAGQKKQLKLPAAAFKVMLTTASRQLTYAFIQVGAKSNSGLHKGWYLSRSDLPFVFRVSDDLVKDLKSPTVASLKLAPSKKTSQQTSPQTKATHKTANKSVVSTPAVSAQ